jgi:hypothetical protein
MSKIEDAVAEINKRKSVAERQLADLESGWQHFTKRDGKEVDITQDLIREYRAEIAVWNELIAKLKAPDAQGT